MWYFIYFVLIKGTRIDAILKSSRHTHRGCFWICWLHRQALMKDKDPKPTTQMNQLRRGHDLVPCHQCLVKLLCKKKGHSRPLQQCHSCISTCQSLSSFRMLTHRLTGEPIRIVFLPSPLLQELACLHPAQVWTVSTCSAQHPTSRMIEGAGFQPVKLRCSSLLKRICHWCLNRHRHLA